MNNGEANDVNVVLDYFLGKPRHDGPVSFERAKAAAVRLAERAYQQLSAGSRGVDVAARFDERAAVVLMVDAALDKTIEEQAAAGDAFAHLLQRRRRPAASASEAVQAAPLEPGTQAYATAAAEAFAAHDGEHVPTQIGTHDAEGHRTHTIPGDVCLGCSDPASGRWVPISQCPKAMAALDATEQEPWVSYQ